MTDFFKQIDEAAEAVSLDNANVIVDRKVLFAALKRVSAAVIKRGRTLPILRNVLFVDSPDGITITATDLDLRISVKLEGAAWRGPVMFCVPYAKLYRAAMNFRASKVGFFVSDNPDTVTIRGGLSALTMKADNPADFPSGLVDLDMSIRNIIDDPGKFLRDLELCAKSSSADDSRPALQTVCITTENARIRLAATDGKRLVSLASSPVNGGDVSALLPARFVGPIRSAFTGTASGGLVMDRYDKQLTFSDGVTSVTADLRTSGGFPNYQQVIPPADRTSGSFRFSAFVMQWAIQSGAICIGINGKIELTLQPGAMTIRGIDEDCSTSETVIQTADDALTLPPGMEKITFLLNYGFLLDSCRIGERITFRFSDELSPTVFECADCVYCVMPILK